MQKGKPIVSAVVHKIKNAVISRFSFVENKKEVFAIKEVNFFFLFATRD
jgi:hypothetical protein